jgi:hypothetical protein
MVAGIAGLVAGAMSMAAGEYVSVRSQADSEQAALDMERAELKANDKAEHQELAAIYVQRGLDPALAKRVAEQLAAHDALGAHSRDELGISETLMARPIQAAFTSAASFAVGAAMPLLAAAVVPASSLIPVAFPESRWCSLGSWWARCARGWRECDDGRHACHVLGRTCDGADGRRRGPVRNGGVTSQTQPTARWTSEQRRLCLRVRNGEGALRLRLARPFLAIASNRLAQRNAKRAVVWGGLWLPADRDVVGSLLDRRRPKKAAGSNRREKLWQGETHRDAQGQGRRSGCERVMGKAKRAVKRKARAATAGEEGPEGRRRGDQGCQGAAKKPAKEPAKSWYETDFKGDKEKKGLTCRERRAPPQ